MFININAISARISSSTHIVFVKWCKVIMVIDKSRGNILDAI